ncbi:MAG: hypothetical protein Ta2F_05400 [Termitinemataceae bacterium]|nr:MAG: hypothetical protein Ta2F_05400 [Termitinemataceae bacterium]
MNLHAFSINFEEHADIAKFNFYFNNTPIKSFFCGISGINAGDMNYDFPDTNPNRLAVFKSLNISSKNIFSFKQIHSRDVVLITQDYVAALKEADGSVTQREDCCLAVTVADCLPVYLLDKANNAIAVLHSGWKGTGIVHNALDIMKTSFNTKPENVSAVLGPCIKSCCYEVSEDRAAVFTGEFGKDYNSPEQYPLGSVVRSKFGRYYIDMQAANAHILAKDGVLNIAYCTNCTYDDHRLGSYRREGALNYTKMIAIAGRS